MFGSLDRDDDVLAIGINRAVDLIARKMASVRTLGPHPADKELIAVRKGRFGPYVQHGKTVANLPRGVMMEEITLDEAVALLAEKGKQLRPRGAAGRRGRGAAAAKPERRALRPQGAGAARRKAAPKRAQRRRRKRPAAKKPAKDRRRRKPRRVARQRRNRRLIVSRPPSPDAPSREGEGELGPLILPLPLREGAGGRGPPSGHAPSSSSPAPTRTATPSPGRPLGRRQWPAAHIFMVPEPPAAPPSHPASACSPA